MRRPRRLSVFPWHVVLVASSVLGCEGNGVSAPVPATDSDELYWTLTLNHHAVNLSTVAPYDTLTLVATPRHGDGTVITGLPAPTFESTDRGRVQVTPEGVIQGIASGRNIRVIARLTANNLTYADTATVNVVADVASPMLASFSAHPVPPDSAKFAAFGSLLMRTRRLPIQALDANGNPISGLAVDFTSSDPTIAEINRSTGLIRALRPGRVTFYASTTAFGVAMADTVPFQIGWPLYYNFIAMGLDGQTGVSPFWDPVEIKLGIGATVIWNNTSAPTDVTFDDPTNVAAGDPTVCAVFGTPTCDAGNIEAFGGEDSRRVRSFPVPGTYDFRSTLHGMAARVIIVDDSETPSAGAVR